MFIVTTNYGEGIEGFTHIKENNLNSVVSAINKLKSQDLPVKRSPHDKNFYYHEDNNQTYSVTEVDVLC